MGWKYSPKEGLSNLYGRSSCKQVIAKKELAEIRRDLQFIIEDTRRIYKEQGPLAGLNTPIKQSDVPRLAMSMENNDKKAPREVHSYGFMERVISVPLSGVCQQYQSESGVAGSQLTATIYKNTSLLTDKTIN